MPRTIPIEGDLAHLLAEFHAARERRQRATPADWPAAHCDERAAALSLSYCIDNRTKEGR